VVRSVNPVDGSPFGPEIPDTDPAAFDAALDAAVAVARSWGEASPGARAVVLRAMADALDGHADELAVLADQETGLGADRLRGEVGRASFQLRLLADLAADGAYRTTDVQGLDERPLPAGHPPLRRTLVPLGPVAVYGASNFPFAFSVPGGDTASALAAGCPVVVKAHPAHPQTSQAVADLLVGAAAAHGWPGGVVALVHGFEAGRRLVTDPRVRAAAFTGSGPGGRALFDLAVARVDPIPFYGELGSVNPVVALASALGDPDRFAADYLASLTLGSGQFCTNPGVLVVPAASGLPEAIAARVVGLAPGRLLSAGVADLLNRSTGQLLATPGVTALAQGPAGDGGFTHPVAVAATDVATVLGAPQLLHLECFGPVGLVVTYDTDAQLAALLDALPGCLVGAVFATQDDPGAAAVVAALARVAGRVVWNGWPTGVAVAVAQHHGGPWPATTNPLHTSVGASAVHRFLRPVTFQSLPDALLPPVVGS